MKARNMEGTNAAGYRPEPVLRPILLVVLQSTVEPLNPEPLDLMNKGARQ